MRWAAPAIVTLTLAACQARPLLPESAAAPAALRSACALTEQKCTRCHGLDRIRMATWQVVDWRLYVGRMRRQSGSGISAGDAEIILECLTHLQQHQRDQHQRRVDPRPTPPSAPTAPPLASRPAPPG